MKRDVPMDRGVPLTGRVERAKAATPPGLRRVARQAIRRWGEGSSGLRPMPDVLVIGGKRAGSSSLYRYLTQHPRFVPTFPSVQRFKGTYYFDKRYDESEAWYRSHFPSIARRRIHAALHGSPVVTGEACPYYLADPRTPRRVAETIPDVRLILTVRNPVDRALSHHGANVRAGIEDLSFAEAIEAEPERLRGEEERLLADPLAVSTAHEYYGYVHQSTYEPLIRRWLGHVDPADLHIGVSEDMYEDPQSFMDRVFAFIGIGPHPLGDTRRVNPGGGATMDPGLRRELAQRFAGANAALADRLGRRLPWDDA